MLELVLDFAFPGREAPFLNLDQALGLASFFIVIGYEVLLFCYFFLIKFRETKKMYWLYFSLFFLFIAISRGLSIIYDYMMPYYINQLRDNPLLPLGLYRAANFIGWLAIATEVGILSTLIFTKEDKLSTALKIITPCLVVIVASLFLILPDSSLIDLNYFIYSDPYNAEYNIDPGITLNESPWPGLGMGSFVLNLIITPAISFVLPVIFFVLAYKSIGVIRKSSALNGAGFLLYWVGRFSKYFFAISTKPGTDQAWSGVTQNVWPAMIICLGLLCLALANMMLQQK